MESLSNESLTNESLTNESLGMGNTRGGSIAFDAASGTHSE